MLNADKKFSQRTNSPKEPDMTQQTKTTKPLPTNKPTTQYHQIDKNLFPNIQTYQNGKTIYQSNPKPDYLTLMIPLRNEVLSAEVAKSVPMEERCKAVSQFLTSGAANTCQMPNFKEKWHPLKYYAREFQLAIGQDNQPLHCTLFDGKKLGPRLRLSFNPSKIGKEGNNQIACLLLNSPFLGAKSLFQKSRFAKEAKLTRLDVAIDCLGITVAEVVARHSLATKRVVWAEGQGAETIYLKSPRGGATHVAIYDKGLEGDFPNAKSEFGGPLTRIEVKKRRFHEKYLSDFNSLADPFKKLWCGDAVLQCSEDQNRFASFRAIRQSYNLEDTLMIMGLTAKQADALEVLTTVLEPNLIRPKKTWEAWADGCARCGISALI